MFSTVSRAMSTRTSGRQQLAVGIALISIVPLLTLAYVRGFEQAGATLSAGALSTLYACLLLTGLGGYLVLRQPISEVRRLRNRLQDALTEEGAAVATAPEESDVAALEHCATALTDQLRARAAAAEGEASRLRDELADFQRLDSLSHMAVHLAHDLNNLLAAISGNLMLIGRMTSDERVSEQAAHADATSRRAHDLLEELLVFAGRGRFIPEAIDLEALTGSIRRDLVPSLPHSVTLNVHTHGVPACIFADVSQTRLAIEHLVRNGAEAYEGRPGEVCISTGSARCTSRDFAHAITGQSLPDGRYGMVEVTDYGQGIPPALIHRVFDPFFSGRIRGRGLGLSLVLGVMRAHEGALTLTSENGKGTTVRMYFPCDRPRLDSL